MAPIRSWRQALPVTLLLIGRSIAAVTLLQEYCSPQNTGLNYAGEVNDYASLGSCDTQCQDSYAFAVVQGTTCWCSNYAPGTQVAVAECSETCPGYPYEYCGSTASNLYGYMALSKSALGTSYTSTSTAVSTATKVSVATTTALATTTAAAQRTTVVVTSVNTIVSTQAIVTTEVNTVAASPTTAILSVTVVQTSIATEQITIVPVASSTNSSSTTLIPSSTSVQRITVSGAVVTQIITASAAPQTTSASIPIVQSKSHGLSSGAAAGVAIGAILGVALLAGLLWFCCCGSRRRGNDGDGEKGLNRNTSVLSKAGLLRRVSHRETTSGGSGAAPRLQTTGLAGISEDPRSAGTMNSNMSMGSNSRPMFVDNRLNPNPTAWSPGHHPNHSTSTLGSLRDYRDYSRPLEVRNPDPH